jgi:SM-20-related protein
MSTSELLSGFSKALVTDDRILNARERELINRILQTARTYTNAGHENEVNNIVARAVGEAVAQRAFTVLGAEIVRQMLEEQARDNQRSVPLTTLGPAPTQPGQPSGPRPPVPNMAFAGPAPTQPGQPSGPRPPVPNMAFAGPAPTQPGQPSGPRPPVPNMAFAGPAPTQPGQPSGPRPPVPRAAHTEAATEVAVVERIDFRAAQFVVMDEFFAPEELNELTEFAISHEAEFSLSEVITPGENGSMVDYHHRRSRVLMNADRYENLVLQRIHACLPQVMQKLGGEVFPVKRVELQITASNDGDFFRHHSDCGAGDIETRELTFVYFFHREPKAFDGGELRIYDTRFENGEYCSTGNGQSITPGQNQVVFFPSSLVHEITAVRCPSQAFADSRFTVNGWFHR